jgi:hypothetical protein
MLQWIITKLISWYASPLVASTVQAVVVDLTKSGPVLLEKAVTYVKEANDNKLENKWDYVYQRMLTECASAGKSAIGTAIEAAESAIKQGLVK